MKTLLTALAIASMVALSGDAFAASHYVGADLGSSKVNGERTNSAGLHLGANVNPNLAVELGVAQSQNSTAAGVKADVLTTSLDVIGILPVTDTKLDLLGTAGVALQTLTAEDQCGRNLNDSGIGATLGAGAQYHLTEAVSVRGLVKYENVDLDTIGQDHTVKSTVGLNVAF